MQIDKKIRKKKALNGTPSVELAARVEKRALRLRTLSECATWQLKKLGKAVCTSILVGGCWTVYLWSSHWLVSATLTK